MDPLPPGSPERGVDIARGESQRPVESVSSYVDPGGSNRGVVVGVAAGAALVLVALIWLLFGRLEAPTSVNVAAAPTATPVDLRISIDLTAQARGRPTATPAAGSTQPTGATSPAQGRTTAAPGAPTEIAGASAAVTPRPEPALQPTSPIPQGWQMVRDLDRICQCAAPPDWQVRAATASDPTGASSVTVQQEPHRGWDAYRQDIKARLRPTATYEDSAERLWVEYGPGEPVRHFVASVFGGLVCIEQIELRTEGAAQLANVVRQIADSLGPVR